MNGWAYKRVYRQRAMNGGLEPGALDERAINGAALTAVYKWRAYQGGRYGCRLLMSACQMVGYRYAAI